MRNKNSKAMSRVEVDSSEIAKIFIQLESKNIKIRQNNKGNYNIRVCKIPLNSKNIFGKKLHKQIAKLSLSQLSMDIKKEFN